LGRLAKERRESQLLILSSLQVEDFLCSHPSENKDEQLPNPLPVKYIRGFLPTLNYSWSTSIAKEALVFLICHPTLYSVFQSCFDPVLGATTVLSLIPTSRLLHPNRHPLISSPGSEAAAPYAFVPINRLLFLLPAAFRLGTRLLCWIRQIVSGNQPRLIRASIPSKILRLPLEQKKHQLLDHSVTPGCATVIIDRYGLGSFPLNSIIYLIVITIDRPILEWPSSIHSIFRFHF
jgi:hypothetical protein